MYLLRKMSPLSRLAHARCVDQSGMLVLRPRAQQLPFAGSHPHMISVLNILSQLCSNMAAHEERTFIMIKPDGVHRGLIGDIIKRFEQKGFKLVAMKFMHVSQVDIFFLHETISETYQYISMFRLSIFNN